MLDNSIKFVQGVGEVRAKLLEKELGIVTMRDMLYHFPFRYIDRTRIYRIADINEDSASAYVQFRAKVTGKSVSGEGRKRRFSIFVSDGSGSAELIWFQGIKWVEKRFELGREYLIFGRPSFFRGELSVIHPEVELVEKALSRREHSGLQGIYSTTERLSTALGTKGLYNIICKFNMLLWLRRQSTSLVRKRSPVRIRLVAPNENPSTIVNGFSFVLFRSKPFWVMVFCSAV